MDVGYDEQNVIEKEIIGEQRLLSMFVLKFQAPRLKNKSILYFAIQRVFSLVNLKYV